MPTPIADAFVRLRPDVTGFRAEVAATVGQTLSSIGTVGAAGATAALTKQVVALQGAAAAGLSAAGAQSAYNAAVAAGGVVIPAATAANTALAASQTQVAASSAGLGAAFARQIAGLRAAADESNLLRGALIGLSRITPVAVFGLGIVGTAAIALGLALRAAIRDAAAFEQSMNVLGAVTEATGSQLEAVSQEAKDLGRDLQLPGVSANDAVLAMTELAKAGLSVEEAMAAARGTLLLATAANISASEAAKITASTLNAFALAGTEAAHVADLLASASINAQGEITDMAAALNQVQQVAHQAGLSVEETVTGITLAAQAGLLGSDAGTSFRTTLLRLTPTTKEAALFQKALGIQMTNNVGEIKDLRDIAEELRVSLAGLSEEQQQIALTQIFGQDAIRFATILAREGAAGVDEMAEANARAGASADIAAARAKGLAGAWAGLTSNAQTLGTSLGLLVTPFLTQLVTAISETVGFINDMVDAVNRLSDAIRDIPDIELPDIPGVPDLPDIPGFDLPDLPDLTDLLPRPPSPKDLALGPLDEVAGAVKDIGEAVADLDFTPFVDMKDAAEELGPALEEATRRAAGLGATTAGIPIGIPDAPGFGRRAVPPDTDIPGLTVAEELNRKIRLETAKLATQINRSGQILRNLGADAFEESGEAFFQELKDQIDSAIAKYQEFGFIAGKALADAARQLPLLTRDLNLQIQDIVPGFEVEPLISNALKEDIFRIAAIPGGDAFLRQTGRDIVAAIAEGVEQSDDLVKAAEEALDKAIEDMHEAIEDSVRQAGDSLDSLAQDLISKANEVIDAMDFGVPRAQRQIIRIELQSNVREATQALRDAKAQGLTGAELDPFIANVNDATETLTNFAKTGKASIETLEDALDSLQRRLQRRQLQFNLRQARREFRDAQNEIVSITAAGTQSAAQRRNVREILDPFAEDVAQAEGAIKTFDLQTTIDELGDVTDAFKKASEDGITKLVQDFKDGKISAERFATAIGSQLQPVLDTLKTKAGENLGLAFTADFMKTFDALVLQARLLTGFLGILGNLGPDVVDPSKVAKEQRAQVAAARKNLEDSLENQKKTAQNTTVQVRLLGLILAAIMDTDRRPGLTPAQRAAGLREAERQTGIVVGSPGS